MQGYAKVFLFGLAVLECIKMTDGAISSTVAFLTPHSTPQRQNKHHPLIECNHHGVQTVKPKCVTSTTSCRTKTTQLFLIPSQATTSKNQKQNKSSCANQTLYTASSDSSSSREIGAGDTIVYNRTENPVRKNDSDSKNTSDSKTRPKYEQHQGQLSKKKRNKSRSNNPSFGNYPNVPWRAISMAHFRRHPNVLPLPDAVLELKQLEDVANFRQGSWQWDALHVGRCTTSQAASALGLLEPHAARAMGIPKSLQKQGGGSAFYRLRAPALAGSLDEMNAILCNHPEEQQERHKTTHDVDVNEIVWEATKSRHTNTTAAETSRSPKKNSNLPRQPKFAARYLCKTTEEELSKWKRDARRKEFNTVPSMRVRMEWGNVQEATSLLTALNYFWKQDPRIMIKEVGMCGAGLEMNSTMTNHGLLLGASPDGVIEYPNRTLEALEVKNHCPFVSANFGNKTNSTRNPSRKQYRIREMPLQPTVPPAYVSQLMIEMLSLGPSCRSAVMVRQTATNGAVILRLHRDDAWIDEMMHWLRRFQTDYVIPDQAPPVNFFWQSEDQNDSERYKKFVLRTKELGESVQLVDYIKNGDIQRVVSATRHQPIPLFLD
mmetsp:Transcript_12225/g.22194  ORF Transcript_12225/g.22194 Transcript_12225/m.22194 type:complete len:603 (-) Transcript_12225:1461-3269(-)